MPSIFHSGVAHDENPPGRGSGRHPWGSGDNPYQHVDNFRKDVDKLRKQGLADKDIAFTLLGEHASVNDLKTKIRIEMETERSINRATALKLYSQTGSASEVARIMYGDPKKESSIRKLLDPVIAEKHEKYQNTADFLKDKIAQSKSGIIDVGSDTELHMGVTKDTKNVAIKMLEEQGYTYTWIKIPQATTRKETTIKVLAAPGMSWKDIQQHKFEVDSIVDYTPDEGKTFVNVQPPVSINSKRVYIRYGDEGGVERDGTIELRRNVPDANLNGSLYSQVRIAVDGKYYMKGMALYSDDVPPGYDIVYNTNKKRGAMIFPQNKNDISVYKLMKDDPDNPFGALIKPVTAGGQHFYTDKDGVRKQSVINKVSDEGDWSNWSKRLSSQFLSKQNNDLIDKQLNVTILDKKAELEQIRSLTNPVIRQKLLDDYAEQCDSNASSLVAKGFKGSAFQVILPITSLKDNEIYAPNYKNGEQVALIRYPHGGVFEIPVLTVNNKNAEANTKITKNAKDAIGINIHNADILSGADFDGDTAMVIPITSNNIKIKYAPPLKELKDWDHKALYRLPNEAPVIKNAAKQQQMGIVTNLINDMTVGGADLKDIAKAVKHSMVVIDSEKHHLDIKRSAKDNDIQALKKKYQEKADGTFGASTILSRASAETYVNQRKETIDISKMTPEQIKAFKAGKKIYIETGKTKRDLKEITNPKKMTEEELKLFNAGKKVYRDTGKSVRVLEKISQMDAVDDAMDLVRDKSNHKEVAYANFANTLKALANEARAESRSIDFQPVSISAKKLYSAEVKSLNEKLKLAKSNSPKERMAQAMTNHICNEKFNDPTREWDYEHKQRERSRVLEECRAQVGAKKTMIDISDREWEAIQANAISATKLKDILNNTDQDAFKKRASNRDNRELTTQQINLIKAMKNSGQYTNAEIANRIGISTSTINNYT